MPPLGALKRPTCAFGRLLSKRQSLVFRAIVLLPLCLAVQELVTTGWLNNLLHKLLEHTPARAVELLAVDDLMEHDRPGWHLNVAHAGAFLVPLVGDHNTFSVNALVRRDPAL